VRAVVQRVSHASVVVDGATVGHLETGLLVLVAAHKDDTDASAVKLADRVANLRIFNDGEGKMNLNLTDAGASGVLAVSNFTVLGDTTQRRPSFVAAAPYERGEELFEEFVAALRKQGISVETGVFGADMKVALTNDGPVTVIVEA
jgi:D-tyrosyl-tRNA(Tyr) deacylase